MSAADDAYHAAQAEIARVNAAGGDELDLNGAAYRALEVLPPEIAELTGLRWLDLALTKVTDLTLLAGMQSLRGLDLALTQVTDLTLLAGMQSLQELSLTATQVTDLTPIAGMQSLQHLHLTNTQVTDLTPLAGMQNLQRLNLIKTQVIDLTPIAGLQSLETLDLGGTQVTDLTLIAGMQSLQGLWLNGTQVADLTPIAGLQNLQRLFLNRTQVADLSPIAGMQSLQTLRLNQSSVRDLRPVLTLSALGESEVLEGLSFRDCAATKADLALKRLSEIEDRDQRLTETLAYLRGLPPWPEPLPWSPAPPQGDTPPDPPAPELGLAMAMIEGCLDVTPHPHGADDDPLRSKSFARLRDAVTGLVRHGNRYPELRPIVDALLTQTEGTLAEASLYDIHLDMGALSDLVGGNAARPEVERIDSECLTAIKAVTRLGPPLTMNDPEVIAFEEAHARYAGKPKGATVARGEERVVEQIGKGGDGIGPGLQGMAARVAAQPVAPGRMATARALITKNTVIYAGLALAGTALLQHTTVEAAKAAWEMAPGIWQFLVANKDSIMAAAAGWGDQAQVWTADLLGRAVEISNLRRGDKSSKGDPDD